MFKVGDRIRTNRSVNIRHGVIDGVDPDGSVEGAFDDGIRFFRHVSMLDDFVLAADPPPASRGKGGPTCCQMDTRDLPDGAGILSV